MLGLGYFGLGEFATAKKHLQEAATMDVNHQGVQVHLATILNL